MREQRATVAVRAKRSISNFRSATAIELAEFVGAAYLLRQRARIAASSIARQPPCPRFGVSGWTASPIKVTDPSPHLLTGLRSKTGLRISEDKGVARINSGTGSHQPSNKRRRSSRSLV